MLHRLLLNPDGGEGDGGKATGSVPPPAPQESDKGPDMARVVENLAREHGGLTQALMHLWGENFKGREKNREKDSALAEREARLGQLEGDLKKLSPYRELGELAELRKALEEREQYRAEAEGFRKAEVIRSAAEVSGFRPGVLGTLAKDLAIEIIDDEKDGKPVLKDGKPVRVAIVRDEGDKAIKLADYAATHWGDFLPSLKAESVPRPLGTPQIARPQPAYAGAGSAPPPPARPRRNGL